MEGTTDGHRRDAGRSRRRAPGRLRQPPRPGVAPGLGAAAGDLRRRGGEGRRPPAGDAGLAGALGAGRRRPLGALPHAARGGARRRTDLAGTTAGHRPAHRLQPASRPAGCRRPAGTGPVAATAASGRRPPADRRGRQRPGEPRLAVPISGGARGRRPAAQPRYVRSAVPANGAGVDGGDVPPAVRRDGAVAGRAGRAGGAGLVDRGADARTRQPSRWRATAPPSCETASGWRSWSGRRARG